VKSELVLWLWNARFFLALWFLLCFVHCYFVLLFYCYTFALVVVYCSSIVLLFICDYSLLLLFVCGWSLVQLLVHHYSFTYSLWLFLHIVVGFVWPLALLLPYCYYFNFRYHVWPCTYWVCHCCSFVLLFHWCSICLANIYPPSSCVGSSYGVWNSINKLHQP
jgi:hypothetical protein